MKKNIVIYFIIFLRLLLCQTEIPDCILFCNSGCVSVVGIYNRYDFTLVAKGECKITITDTNGIEYDTLIFNPVGSITSFWERRYNLYTKSVDFFNDNQYCIDDNYLGFTSPVCGGNINDSSTTQQIKLNQKYKWYDYSRNFFYTPQTTSILNTSLIQDTSVQFEVIQTFLVNFISSNYQSDYLLFSTDYGIKNLPINDIGYYRTVEVVNNNMFSLENINYNNIPNELQLCYVGRFSYESYETSYWADCSNCYINAYNCIPSSFATIDTQICLDLYENNISYPYLPHTYFLTINLVAPLQLGNTYNPNVPVLAPTVIINMVPDGGYCVIMPPIVDNLYNVLLCQYSSTTNQPFFTNLYTTLAIVYSTIPQYIFSPCQSISFKCSTTIIKSINLLSNPNPNCSIMIINKNNNTLSQTGVSNWYISTVSGDSWFILLNHFFIIFLPIFLLFFVLFLSFIYCNCCIECRNKYYHSIKNFNKKIKQEDIEIDKNKLNLNNIKENSDEELTLMSNKEYEKIVLGELN